MPETTRVPEDATLTVDQVAAIARRDRQTVLRAIDNRALAAHQQRGEWVVLARDMRRWLGRQ